MKEMLKINTKTPLHIIDKEMLYTELFITFYQKEGKELEGKIFNPHIPYGVNFRGYGELFLKIERIYDLLGCPKAEFDLKDAKKQEWKGSQLEDTEGWDFEKDVLKDFRKVYTPSLKWMYIDTLRRQHGSWQGICRTAETGELRYRSALELLHYIYNYIEEK